ncbi:fibrinogen C domain-containing protein 1-like [Rhopilema esculentum]|uniref:fibrinogen C domain-containing protein 1-like n=1 Tax=Rhopilema esculentum TaxID=499914 RepID=UPI0031E21478
MKQPEDCKDLYDSGKKESGVYHITRPNKQVIKVYCDMETDGGGWTVIQRRIDGSTDFQRGWSDYKHGFGNVEKNFWIGLQNMHSFTSPNASTTLRIELKHWLRGDNLFFAKYGSFEIGNETDGYTLSVSRYSGTAGDGFNNIEYSHMQNNGQKFTTLDRDNDKNFVKNCAVIYEGGWWYNAATSSQLNGLYPDSENSDKQYMTWFGISNSFGNIKFSEMKIRRN